MREKHSDAQRFMAVLTADQVVLGREKGRFGAAGDLQFGGDVLDVIGRGFACNDLSTGDLLVRVPPGKEAKDLDFAGGQPVRKGSPRAGPGGSAGIKRAE
jgi:hypothetical protein